MLDWLNDNSSAVQAISSVILLIVTAALLIVTAYYAVLTGRIAKANARLVEHAQKDLTLTAYAQAVQGILDLKRTFAEHPSVFDRQIEISPQLQSAIPEYMPPEAFLTFAGGMWRMSYVFSVMNRWKELEWTQEERDGLKKEMLLWLQHVPGFYDVYRKHTSRFQAHNPDFLRFLKEEVYGDKFFNEILPARSAGIPSDAEKTNLKVQNGADSVKTS